MTGVRFWKNGLREVGHNLLDNRKEVKLNN